MHHINCPKCKRIPMASYLAGEVFNCHTCHDQCGYQFWTLKVCPNCNQPQKTVFLNKPNFGQLIQCGSCRSQMYYFRCSESTCMSLFFRNREYYAMGSPVTCASCNKTKKLITCPCGGELALSPEKVLFQGNDQFKCQCCGKILIYTVCPFCKHPDFHMDRLDIGDRIRCSSCKAWRKYVPCPKCGKTLPYTDFSFCQTLKCDDCKFTFEYTKCPQCTQLNFQSVGYHQKGPDRKCYSQKCRQVYFAVNCGKCKDTIYFDKIDKSIGNVVPCPRCNHKISMYWCGRCNNFNNQDTKCIYPQCPLPHQIIDNTIKKVEVVEQKVDNQCKICFANQREVMNEVCGHLMMCQACLRDIQRRTPNARDQNAPVPCPVCKAIGRYFKFRKPIYS